MTQQQADTDVRVSVDVNASIWDPPNHVVLSWQIEVRFEAQYDPERASRVDVRFAADSPDRTTVTVVHSDFERHGEGSEGMRTGVSGDGGWAGSLNGFAATVSS